MRNLREKLNAMATRPREAKPDAEPGKLWQYETLVPYDALMGIENSSLTEVCACDPMFRAESWDIKRLLFLDTETTGLAGGAGTLAFLLGIAWLEENGLRVHQFMIRSYPQERDLLSFFLEALKDHDTLVTFNGKSFDIPLLDSRLILNGLRRKPSDLPHLDLLHACRRVYRMRLGRCTLRMLEEVILDKHRDNDLPGSEAPQRFFTYLKTGFFEPLLEVARHNMEDVISLAQLTGHLCAVFRNPESLAFPEDKYSVARAMERTGDLDKASDVYRQLTFTPLSSPAHRQLAGIERRRGHPDAAAKEWEAMIRLGFGETEPYIALAKYYEHTLCDYERAVRYASDALNIAFTHMEISSAGADEEVRSICKRIERLRRKQYTAEQSGGKI